MMNIKLQAKQRLQADCKKDLEHETNPDFRHLVTELSKLVHITSVGDPSVYEGQGGEVYFRGKESNPVDVEYNCISFQTMKKILGLMEHLGEESCSLCPWEDNQLCIVYAKI